MPGLVRWTMRSRVRKLIVPTVMTLAMLPVLVWLGFWQLERAAWKEQLLDHIRHNPKLPVAEITSIKTVQPAWEYRRASVSCTIQSQIVDMASTGGFTSGRVPYQLCTLSSGDTIAIKLPPITVDPLEPVTGTLRFWQEPSWQRKLAGNPPLTWADFKRPSLARFYLDTSGSVPNADDIANNHLLYAVQWFCFAGILSVIYALFVRMMWRSEA